MIITNEKLLELCFELSCQEQYDLAIKIAGNVGYVLVAEYETSTNYTRWEHEVATINVTDRKAQLDAFGLKGWHLVQLFEAGGRSWEAVFKREVIIREGVE